jgi:coenzyme F420-reducing hydrogenase delta subunit
MRRVKLLKRTLVPFGINPDRVKLVWASAAEGVQLTKEIGIFVEEIREMGPLNWQARVNPESIPETIPVEEVAA